MQMQYMLNTLLSGKNVYRNMPADLAQVVAAWENIDVETRRKIVAMIG